MKKKKTQKHEPQSLQKQHRYKTQKLHKQGYKTQKNFK